MGQFGQAGGPGPAGPAGEAGPEGTSGPSGPAGESGPRGAGGTLAALGTGRTDRTLRSSRSGSRRPGGTLGPGGTCGTCGTCGALGTRGARGARDALGAGCAGGALGTLRALWPSGSSRALRSLDVPRQRRLAPRALARRGDDTDIAVAVHADRDGRAGRADCVRHRQHEGRSGKEDAELETGTPPRPRLRQWAPRSPGLDGDQPLCLPTNAVESRHTQETRNGMSQRTWAPGCEEYRLSHGT